MKNTVDLDTAVCTRETMRELSDTQLALTFSIYSVMEEKLWYFAQKHDAFSDPKWEARSKQVTDAMDTIRDAYLANYPEKCFVWYCHGTTRSDEYTYTGIERAITEEFGTEGISLMSARDYFSVEVSDAKMEPLRKFLKELDPDLAFSQDPIDKDCIGKPVEGGWSYTNEIVKKAKIKVVIAMPDLTPKHEDIISDRLVTAKKSLEKTGLSEEEALGRLIDLMGFRPCPVDCLAHTKK